MKEEMLTKRKLVSIAISICMILTLIPANAFATETEGTAPVLKISKEGKGITLSWDVAENANRYIVLKKNSNGEFEKYKELEVEEKQTAQKESPSEAEIKDETWRLEFFVIVISSDFVLIRIPVDSVCYIK